MDELFHSFSPACQARIQVLLDHAALLDQQIKPHMLTFVNEEGFMERAPGPSEAVRLWVRELAHRKAYYSVEEVTTWLKQERDTFLNRLRETSQKDHTRYYELYLELINQALKEGGKQQPEGDRKKTADIKNAVIDLIKDNRLQEAAEKLDEHLQAQPASSALRNELILHIAKLRDIQSKERQGLVDSDDALRVRSQVSAALLNMLGEISG